MLCNTSCDGLAGWPAKARRRLLHTGPLAVPPKAPGHPSLELSHWAGCFAVAGANCMSWHRDGCPNQELWSCEHFYEAFPCHSCIDRGGMCGVPGNVGPACLFCMALCHVGGDVNERIAAPRRCMLCGRTAPSRYDGEAKNSSTLVAPPNLRLVLPFTVSPQHFVT